jgi:hypothetical protein
VPIEINTGELMQQQIKSGARMTQGAPMHEPHPEPHSEEVNEQIVEPESTPADPVPKMRGSLAASIASTTVHKQELITDPRKPIGPARI